MTSARYARSFTMPARDGPATCRYLATKGVTAGLLPSAKWATPVRWLADVPIWDYHGHMHLVAVKILRVFGERFPDSEQHLKAWADEVRKASWKQPGDIKQMYRSASILKNRRVVFNVKGNDYRLVVSIAYRFQAVYIKFIGTHEQYDAIDAETVELES